MAGGWASDGAVQDQIDAGIADEVGRVRRRLGQGPSLKQCAECGEPIPEARRKALPGVRLCLGCQQELDEQAGKAAGINRRGSKDSQLR